MRGVALEFAGGAHYGEVARIGLELQLVGQIRYRQFQSIVMDMHMGRNMQAASMGVQKRRQTLQECQNQKQEIIMGILSHGRILFSNSTSGNFCLLAKPGEGS